MFFMYVSHVLRAYSNAKIIKIKRVFLELWSQTFFMNHSVDTSFEETFPATVNISSTRNQWRTQDFILRYKLN